MNSETVIILSLLNIFLAFLIFSYNFSRNRNIVFLSLYLIVFSIYVMVIYLLVKGGPLWLFALLLNNFAPLFYLLPVMFYFYIRNTLTDTIRFRPFDFIHFIPFVINLLAVLPYIFTSWDYKLSVAQQLMCNFEEYLKFDFKLFYPHTINLIARPVQLAIYFVSLLFLFVRFIPKFKASTGNQKAQFKVVIYLLSVLFLTFVFFCVTQMVFIIQLLNSADSAVILNQIQKKLEIFGYFYFLIPLSVLSNPKFSYGMPQIDKSVVKLPYNDSKPVKDKTYWKNVQKKVKADDNHSFNELGSEILNFIQTEKPFLNPLFSVNDICIKLNVPQHHVQYCFNVIMKKKFPELKNELRVEYAKQLLLNNSVEKLKLEGIGELSGFASASNFFSVFKKVTGVSPKQWMKNNGNAQFDN